MTAAHQRPIQGLPVPSTSPGTPPSVRSPGCVTPLDARRPPTTPATGPSGRRPPPAARSSSARSAGPRKPRRRDSEPGPAGRPGRRRHRRGPGHRHWRSARGSVTPTGPGTRKRSGPPWARSFAANSRPVAMRPQEPRGGGSDPHRLPPKQGPRRQQPGRVLPAPRRRVRTPPGGPPGGRGDAIPPEKPRSSV